jgi:Uma2 family endonuclease
MITEHQILDRLTLHSVAEKHYYYGVTWADYLNISDEFGDESHLRLTFDHGVLEIISPKRLHEQLIRLVDMIVSQLAFELGLNIDNCGSMTIRSESAQLGGEPDSSFYIGHEEQVRGVQEIDLAIHPPPDIVVEIDITSPSLNKFNLYASVGVPEIWIYDGKEMRFYALVDKTYQSIAHSKSFSHLSPEMLERYLQIGRTEGSTIMLQLIKNELPTDHQ